MQKSSPFNSYLVKAEPFAIPILEKIRAIVHDACPDTEEVLKWGFPHFLYKGKILCSMAAFKHHCAFGFWLGSKMDDPAGILEKGNNKNAMGNLGKITAAKKLPSAKTLKAYIRQAMKLTDEGVTLGKKTAADPVSLVIPPDLLYEFKKNPAAHAVFKAFPPSHKKEYLMWILEAKREETRLSRIKKAINMMKEGKSRNWKYETKKRNP